MTGATVIIVTLLIFAAFAALGVAALIHFAATSRRPWDEGYPVRRRPEDE